MQVCVKIWLSGKRKFVACINHMKREKCTNYHISFMMKFFCDSPIALRAIIGPQKIRNLQKTGNKNWGEHSTNTCVYTAISLLCRPQCSAYLYSPSTFVDMCASNYVDEWGCHNYQLKIVPLPLGGLKLSLPFGSASVALCSFEKQAVRCLWILGYSHRHHDFSQHNRQQKLSDVILLGQFDCKCEGVCQM